MRRPHWYLVIAGLVLVSLALALGLARARTRPLPARSDLLPFDREAWQDPRAAAGESGESTPRQRMVADVVKRVLPDRRRVELEQALGPSRSTPYFATTGRDLIYLLGPQPDSSTGLDSEWLLIWLDKTGRFERYEIVRD